MSYPQHGTTDPGYAYPPEAAPDPRGYRPQQTAPDPRPPYQPGAPDPRAPYPQQGAPGAQTAYRESTAETRAPYPRTDPDPYPSYPRTDSDSYAPYQQGPPTPGSGTPDVADASVGQLFGNISRDLSALMRQELALAKAEVKEEATKAGKGAGKLGFSAFAGYMVLLFLSFALVWGLGNVLDNSWAAFLVALLWAGVAAALYYSGRADLGKVKPVPKRTVDTLRQVPDALKTQ